MGLQTDLSALTEHDLDELLILQASIDAEEFESEQERSRNNERLALQADFSAFAKAAWPILEPGNVLVWSWHYDLIAEYLTLAAEKKCKRLIINIPPRTLKSILITIMFPVWVWTRTPNQSFACASYSQSLSEELSVKRRRLLESEWFQRLWGDRIWLQKDQNQKSKFQNNYQAQMFATSVGGTMQGIGGQFLLTDDALKATDVLSEATITELHKWFDDTWRRRLNDPAVDVMVVVEQRTGELDITGHCLAGDKILEESGQPKEWTHLCIPLEADEEAIDKKTLTQRFVYPISGKVKDRFLGDVLQPQRFTPAVIAAKKVQRLTWATQEQGRPSPLEGNLIKRSEVKYYGGRDPETGEADEQLPAKFDLILTSVDAAFKDLKTSDYVAVGTIGVYGRKRFVLEVVNKHLDAPATETEAKRQRDKWKSSVVLIEDKANGSAIIKSMKRSVPGVVAVEPEGGKFARFMAMCGEWQAGDWYVHRTEAWVEQTIEQLTKFPGVKNDDICDCISQSSIYLQKKSHIYGMTEYLKLRDEEMKREARVKQTRLPQDVDVISESSATPPEIGKIDHVDGITKPDVDDGSLRCPNMDCRSTAVSRIAGGHRCSQCGLQFNQPQPTGGNQLRNAGMFRK